VSASGNARWRGKMIEFIYSPLSQSINRIALIQMTCSKKGVLSMKSRPKYGFSGYSDEALNEKMQWIIDQMTGNPHFPTPTPAIPVLQAKVDAYAAAILAANSRAVGTVSARNEIREEAELLFKELAGYIMSVTSVKSVIDTSGFDSTGPSNPIGELPAPQITVQSGQGSIKIDIKPVRGAINYIVEMCDVDPQTPGAEFRIVATPTRSRVTIECPPLVYRWVRCRANGSAGESDHSAIIRCSAY
ncbi:MAG TPA: hypothetical protein VNJ07_10750, partial [Chitinophagales bacterium]|nr:hypothetical protein [Chitinophagales bacterium]